MSIEHYIETVTFSDFRGEPKHVLLFCDDTSQDGNFWIPQDEAIADREKVWEEVCDSVIEAVCRFRSEVEDTGEVVIDGEDFKVDEQGNIRRFMGAGVMPPKE